MTEADLHRLLVTLTFVAAGAIFFVRGTTAAPYGRHVAPGHHGGVPDPLAWIAVGLPSVGVFALVYARGTHAGEAIPLVFAGLWMGHFLYRALVYPLRRRSTRRVPVHLVARGIFAAAVLAYLQARWLSELGPPRTWRWLLTFRFGYGLLLFVTGLGVNRWADAVLRKIRPHRGAQYEIPRGGLYEDVSCPNYFGEIAQWLGWAIATWSLAGLALAMVTAAQLLPRAVSHHRWYQRRFADYPRRRHALVPYVL